MIDSPPNFYFSEPISDSQVEFFVETRNNSLEFLHNSQAFKFSETKEFLRLNSQHYRIVEFQGQQIGYFRYRIDGRACQIGADLHPDFRGRGLARGMYFAFIQQHLSGTVVEVINLRVLKSNRRAINLYNSMGFSKIAESEIDFEMECDLRDLVTLLQKTLQAK